MPDGLKTLHEALKEFHNAPVTRRSLWECISPEAADGYEWNSDFNAWVKVKNASGK